MFLMSNIVQFIYQKYKLRPPPPPTHPHRILYRPEIEKQSECITAKREGRKAKQAEMGTK